MLSDMDNKEGKHCNTGRLEIGEYTGELQN